jgi:hypothetical protein
MLPLIAIREMKGDALPPHIRRQLVGLVIRDALQEIRVIVVDAIPKCVDSQIDVCRYESASVFPKKGTGPLTRRKEKCFKAHHRIRIAFAAVS